MRYIGVKPRGSDFEAFCGTKSIGVYKTSKEAAIAYNEYVKGKFLRSILNTTVENNFPDSEIESLLDKSEDLSKKVLDKDKEVRDND